MPMGCPYETVRGSRKNSDNIPPNVDTVLSVYFPLFSFQLSPSVIRTVRSATVIDLENSVPRGGGSQTAIPTGYRLEISKI